MIALAAEQLEHNNIMPCNQPNRQKPGGNYRKKIMAFLGQPHSSLTIPTSIMLGVGEESCHLMTARLFRLQWTTSLPGERIAHCRWRP